MKTEPPRIVITRGQVAILGMLLGGGGILAALLSWFSQGSITLLTGGFLLGGVLGLVLWYLMTPQDFRAFFTGRQAQRGAAAVFSTLLLAGIVALTYIIVQRALIVADVTIDQRFTLTNQTLEIIRSAQRSPRPIEITAFYNSEQVAEREVDDQYFQLYEEASSGWIRRRYVDPIVEPGFAERYSIAISQGFNVFVSYVGEDGLVDASSTLPVERSGAQERDLTQAIARLLSAGAFKVYFERSLETLDPIDNTIEGMSIFNNLMQTNGIITDALDLRQIAVSGGRIPQDASALIIIRPRRTMSGAEIAVLNEYLNRGGALFIAADLLFAGDPFSDQNGFNNYLWQRFGLRFSNALVVDYASSRESPLNVIGAAVFTSNEIGANLNVEDDPSTGTLFNLARAIEVSDDPPVQNGRVIMTSTQSYGERNIQLVGERNEFQYEEAEDIPGPLTLVAWAYDEAVSKAKVVMVGDANFATNGYAQSPVGNTILFLDSIGWMTGFSEEVRFEPRPFLTAPVLFINSEILDITALVTLILMPGALFVIALALQTRRMRR